MTDVPLSEGEKKAFAWLMQVQEEAYERGRKDALDEAHDAVEIALLGTLQPTRDRALAAIDALKEDK